MKEEQKEEEFGNDIKDKVKRRGGKDKRIRWVISDGPEVRVFQLCSCWSQLTILGKKNTFVDCLNSKQSRWPIYKHIFINL